MMIRVQTDTWLVPVVIGSCIVDFCCLFDVTLPLVSSKEIEAFME